MFSAKKSALVSELKAAGLGGGRVLAWAQGEGDSAVVALDDLLAVRDEQGWHGTGWHLIQGGGWNKERSALRWTTNSGEDHAIELVEPGRIPEAFNERVTASFVVQQSFDAPGGGRVLIAGRRPIGHSQDDAAVVWQAVSSGKASLADPVVRDFVVARTAELRDDYASQS